MSGKMICPDCNGSGFLEEDIKLNKNYKKKLVKHLNIFEKEKECTNCDNTGEIEINEENLEIFFEINSSRLQ